LKKCLLSTVFALFATSAYATCTPPLVVKDGSGASQNLSVGVDPSGNCLYNFGNSAAITNPTSTLTLPAATTAYTAGELIASSATAGSVVVPSFSIPNTAGGFYAPRMRLATNDATSTGWPGVQVQIDLWSAAPTFSTGDRTTWALSTGSQGHLAAYSCALSAVNGDGEYTECAPAVGTTPAIKLASGTSVFWTAQTVSATGATGASGVFTLTAELSN
jgi:hypothetical protein